MRKGEWPESTPVSGIEAVGTVAADPSGALAEGTKVLAIMGGLGRVRNGSYAAVHRGARDQRGRDRDLAGLDGPGCDSRELRHRLARAVRELEPGGVDCVLDLVGNSVLRDSVRAVRPGAGFARPGSSAIPFQEIVTSRRACSAFDEIAEAHRMMEASQAAGKLVVRGG